MPAHITYVAALADGTVATRSSETMAYTHAVEVTGRNGAPNSVWSWHNSETAADKTAARMATWTNDPRFAGVVGVVAVTTLADH